MQSQILALRKSAFFELSYAKTTFLACRMQQHIYKKCDNSQLYYASLRDKAWILIYILMTEGQENQTEKILKAKTFFLKIKKLMQSYYQGCCIAVLVGSYM
jgi:hypothetical protein